MFHFEIALLLACGTIRTGLAADKITIVPRYSSNYMTLTCTASTDSPNDFHIHLSCPFLENPQFCYSNCKSGCKYDEFRNCVRYSSLNMITSCKKKSISRNEYSVIYSINTTLVNQTGEWLCLFKGLKSNVVSLAKYELSTTTQSTAKAKTKFQTKDVELSEITSTKEIHTRVPVYRLNSTMEPTFPIIETPNSKPNIIMQHLTRPELVLALVVMLGFSLLLNLSFLIRCVLLKSVVDNYHRGIPNSSCILGCLCIDQYSQKRKYSRSLNLSNQIGSDFYRCQQMLPDNVAIYDDLSAVSNSSARNKFRSNQGSDIDEDTRLSTLMSNGTCHINPMGIGSVSTSLPRRYTGPSHAAYFHPGLGNYVIVSGPIATQDQYTIGTAPPGYALQMVSPIPSAPGSLTGGHLTNNSVQSCHSDDIFDSDNSQTANPLINQSTKLNNQIELIDSNKIIDIPLSVRVPINGYDQNRHHSISNQSDFSRPNGSVPLHPWPMENVLPPNTSSAPSLPQYSASENGAFVN